VRLREALARHGRDADLHITRYPGHAVELARDAALAGADRLVAVGGDGTIHEVANGMLRALDEKADLPVTLGLAPVGTGNDFVKVVGRMRDLSAAIDVVLNGEVRRFDAARASWSGGGEYFVNAAGTGIDVEVVRVLDRTGGRGAMVYVKALARALRKYRPIPLRLAVDGKVSDSRVMMIAIANGQSVGGAFRICPEARPDDGLLDICTVREMPLLRSILTAARIVRGHHSGLKSVTMQRGRHIEVSVPAGTQLFFQLDGELREPSDAGTLTVEVLPRALPVTVPRGA